MYRNCPEHPGVAMTLRAGEHTNVKHSNSTAVCAGKGCDAEFFIGESVVYEIDGELHCEDCYKDWAKDFIDSNPRETADLLKVDNYIYQGE